MKWNSIYYFLIILIHQYFEPFNTYQKQCSFENIKYNKLFHKGTNGKCCWMIVLRYKKKLLQETKRPSANVPNESRPVLFYLLSFFLFLFFFMQTINCYFLCLDLAVFQNDKSNTLHAFVFCAPTWLSIICNRISK